MGHGSASLSEYSCMPVAALWLILRLVYDGGRVSVSVHVSIGCCPNLLVKLLWELAMVTAGSYKCSSSGSCHVNKFQTHKTCS